jgi:hypothetical protein
MKILFIKMMVFSFLFQNFGESFTLGRENSHIQVDFKSQVRKFCLGKFDNFCSEEHIKLMFAIEEKLQMSREMKRMEKAIIRSIFKMGDIIQKQ